MIESPGDVEALRRVLLKMAPRMEARQPGITQQLQAATLSEPMQLALPGGERVSVQVEPRAQSLAIKVAIQPPIALDGRLASIFWRWRIRLFTRWALKALKKAISRETTA